MKRFSRPLRVLGAYLAGCALLTLGPLPRVPLDVVVWMAQVGVRTSGGVSFSPTHPQVEAVANVVLFVPIGYLLGRAFPRRPRPVLLAGTAAGSAAIELVQHTVLSGRYSTVRDVVLNSLGAAVGLALAGRRSTEVPTPAA